MFAQDDERDDENRDEDQEDADLDEENSEEEEDNEEDGDDSEDSSDDEDSENEDEEEDDDDDDNKPVTRKELREALSGKRKGNNRNAKRRVSSKNRDSSPSSNQEGRISNLEVAEKKRTFGHENNLSPKQVDFVFKQTKRPTKKFIERAEIKAALDAIAAQSNVRDNTPGSSGRGFKSQSGKSWEKMDDREKQDNLADRRRAIIASKK